MAEPTNEDIKAFMNDLFKRVSDVSLPNEKWQCLPTVQTFLFMAVYAAGAMRGLPNNQTWVWPIVDDIVGEYLGFPGSVAGQTF